jgi:hypothetical protein
MTEESSAGVVAVDGEGVQEAGEDEEDEEDEEEVTDDVEWIEADDSWALAPGTIGEEELEGLEEGLEQGCSSPSSLLMPLLPEPVLQAAVVVPLLLRRWLSSLIAQLKFAMISTKKHTVDMWSNNSHTPSPLMRSLASLSPPNANRIGVTSM